MNDMPYTDKNGLVYKYGEFFPAEMSPTAYNESFAYENFPLLREQVEKTGLIWREPEDKNFSTTIDSKDIPDSILYVAEGIIKEVISCRHNKECVHECAGAFKITSQELQFYKKLNIPLPKICPNCRHYARFAWRNPIRLWHRKCMKEGCTNEFETSYAPDRPEIVYCETCYNSEVA